jgi:hypothetical protein
MNTKQRDIWRKMRQKGRFRFILSGALLFGFSATFLSFLYDYGFEFFFNDEPNYLHESERFLPRVLFRLVVLSLAGTYTSYYLWNRNEEIFFRNGQEK